jgi:hypothetical protein
VGRQNLGCPEAAEPYRVEIGDAEGMLELLYLLLTTSLSDARPPRYP